MLRAILTILVAAILLASASIALLVNFPGVLKPVASMIASRITGYELSISGNLRTTFSLQPTFIAEGVSLTNAKWAQETHLANVEYVRVQVDLPGLFEKRIELLELFVRNGRGAIEISSDRVSNLDFRSEEDEPSDDSWEFLVQGLTVDNVSIITHFGELPPILLENVRGNGSIHLEEVPRFIFRGQSDHLDLVALEEALMEFEEDEEEDEHTKIFPDDQIPLEWLLSLNADVDVVIRKFSTHLLSFDEVSASLTLEDGTIEVDQFEFRDAIGHFSATGSMRPSGDQFVVSASLAGDDADLGLFTSPDQPADSVPRYTLDVDLQGRGGSVAEIMGTLDGTITIHSDGGQIDNDLIDLIGGDFLANVLGSLFPFEDPLPYTRMECLVFKGRASDGVLSLKPGFTARTPKVNAFVLGNVDLRNETLAISFATQARSGIGTSVSSVLNPYFMIGGSIAEPELDFDTASAAVAYSLAAGTGGLSILIQGFMDRIRGEHNSCDEYLKLDY